ncbi:ribosome maturation factor RimM [Actinoallomurus purpureus]|uniref:ribosome maturation factor RimM n=1 Tax=Actinoallomurus purpureus TaxID=478114 RepID=UPI002093775E|nr:ribosome maturation factor RimM [Actinoallomurus purpureus]MCO6011691.1 ribosome maturation factor RimM [Actinoallomurus purpureus]
MLLAVGRIGRAHGVRGEVSVETSTDDPGARFAPGSSLVTDPARLGPLTIESVRPHTGRLLVRFAGVDDRTAAETLRGALLLVDSADILPSDDPDEFHDQELIGLVAVTTDGTEVGQVVDVEHLGQDLLVIRRPAGDTLVPFVHAIVPEVDLPGGRIVIDPPPGLLE